MLQPMAWEMLQPPGRVMRKETEPESLILAVCRTLEKQSEVPCNNDLLHSAVKGAEPRENRRLNELFWDVPNFYTRSAGAAGTNCVLWEEKGELPCSVAGPGYTCMLPRSAQLDPGLRPGGLQSRAEAATPEQFGCWSR